MNQIAAICAREFRGYFATPVAYVFIVIFLVLTGVFTFNIGGFYERGQADLEPFFQFHPWLYMLLIPAISMRLWSEERKSGTIELLMTLPISLVSAVVGKFLAAWAFTAVALALTFPIIVTVNYLGDPDNLVILSGYLGSLLMAGGFLAIGACISAFTKNQVVAFVLSFVASFAFNLAGYPVVLDFFSGWAPPALVEVISSLSFLTHFDAIVKGVLDLRDVVFFVTTIALWLYLNTLVVEANKAKP